MYNGITLDGVTYDVRIVYGSIKRAFVIEEGSNAGTSVGHTRIRDIIGTSYSYTMQIEANPQNMADYNEFYDVISSPVNTHTIVAPYGDETITFECCIDSGEDTDMGIFANERKWQGLTVLFSPLKPQR